MPCGDVKIFSGICPMPTVAVYRRCHLSLSVPAVIDTLYKILPLLFRHAAAVFLSKGRPPFSQCSSLSKFSLSERSSVQSLVSSRYLCRNTSLYLDLHIYYRQWSRRSPTKPLEHT